MQQLANSVRFEQVVVCCQSFTDPAATEPFGSAFFTGGTQCDKQGQKMLG